MSADVPSLWICGEDHGFALTQTTATKCAFVSTSICRVIRLRSLLTRRNLIGVAEPVWLFGIFAVRTSLLQIPASIAAPSRLVLSDVRRSQQLVCSVVRAGDAITTPSNYFGADRTRLPHARSTSRAARAVIGGHYDHSRWQ